MYKILNEILYCEQNINRQTLQQIFNIVYDKKQRFTKFELRFWWIFDASSICWD